MLAAITAFFIDTVIGDPRTKFHPVVLMGRFISFLERIFYRKEDKDWQKIFSGGILVAIALLVTFHVASALVFFSKNASIYLGSKFAPDMIPAATKWINIFLQGFFLSFMISPKSLSQAAREIFSLLIAEKMDEARRKLSWIVGRDTDNLAESEICRATVETVSENTVDGIISPLFFFAVGGLPFAAVYRMANTLDSMIAYKNEKYLYFGRIAARVDDLLNLIPARITAMLFIFSAFGLGYDAKNAFDIMRRDANKHPSPNGGYAEATVAGALHIRLGGVNSYFGQKTFREFMGDAEQVLAPRHIIASIKLMYTATILFLIAIYVFVR